MLFYYTTLQRPSFSKDKHNIHLKVKWLQYKHIFIKNIQLFPLLLKTIEKCNEKVIYL